MNECPIPKDVFRIILKHSYPQIAVNLLQSCKKISQLADNSLYLFWLEKFFPWTLENIECNENFDPKPLFIKEWQIPRYVELYKEDDVYDIERLMHLTRIPNRNGIGKILATSRFPSATALNTFKLEPIHIKAGSHMNVILKDECMITVDIRTLGRNVEAAFSIFNRETFLQTSKLIKAAQKALHDKMYYYNITAYGSTVYVHNITLIKPLANRRNIKICALDVGTTIKKMKFEIGYWNDPMIEREEYVFLMSKPETGKHSCNCEFCPKK